MRRASRGTSAQPGADALARSLVTPEGIDLGLTLGSASERAGAFLVDLALMVGALGVVTLLAGLLALGTHGLSLAGIVWLAGFFVLRNFYFTGFELRPRGATPGKRALGLRVVSRDGGRLAADAVLARNLMRELEFFLPLSLLLMQGEGVQGWMVVAGLAWSATFALLPLFNRDRLRAGDLLGGTWVVRVPRRDLLPDLAEDPRRALDFTPAQLDHYGVHELQTLEGVLRRRDGAVMAAVADRIRARVGWDGTEDDVVFLGAFYTALRGHLETRLLFGHRRKDKHDRP